MNQPATVDPPVDGAALRARIESLAWAVPRAVHGEPDTPPASLEEHRRTVRERAWLNSLNAGHVGDLAAVTLADLADDQHPKPLGQFVSTIGPDAPVMNLILSGRVGAGKSTAAIAAGTTAVAEGHLTRFVKHTDYLRWLRPDSIPDGLYEWQIRRRYRECALLVLDDLGAGLDVGVAASRHVREETTALIGDRIDAGRATILTTNIKSPDLGVMIDDRLVSRLSKRGYALTYTGSDRRGRLSW